MSGVLAILLAVGGLLLLLALAIAAALVIRLWPVLRLLWRFAQMLPDFRIGMRVAADALTAAGSMAAATGRVACGSGQAVRAAGGILESVRVPMVTLQTASLWDFLKLIPLLSQVDFSGLPAAPVVTGVQVLQQPIFGGGQTPVSDAGGRLMDVGGRLGYACTSATDTISTPPTSPPPPNSIAREFHDAGVALRAVSDALLEV